MSGAQAQAQAQADPVEPEVEPVEPAIEPVVESATIEPVEPTPPEPAKPAEPGPQDWRTARLAKQSGRIKELQEELAKFKSGAPTGDSAPDQSAQIERLANERAQQLAAQAAFNAQCDVVAVAGRKAFPDFEAKITALTQLIDRNDQDSIGAYNRFLEVAIGTGEAEKILHRLGSAPDEAARLMGLSPVKMAMEMAKMAVAPQPQVSGAPKPITPIGSKGTSHEAIQPDDPERADKLDKRLWFERRNKQVADRQSA